MNRAALSFLFRIVIGGIFLVSGLAKISDPVLFMFSLRGFRLFPEALIPLLAIVLPWLEFFLGLFTVVGLLYRTSSLMLAALNLIFMGAILTVVFRGIDVDCGCFGLLADMLPIPDEADSKAVLRNAVFIAASLYIFLAENTMFALEDYLKRS